MEVFFKTPGHPLEDVFLCTRQQDFFLAFPHLHFQVQDAGGKDITTRFSTKREVKYLRPAKWYRSAKN